VLGRHVARSSATGPAHSSGFFFFFSLTGPPILVCFYWCTGVTNFPKFFHVPKPWVLKLKTIAPHRQTPFFDWASRFRRGWGPERSVLWGTWPLEPLDPRTLSPVLNGKKRRCTKTCRGVVTWILEQQTAKAYGAGKKTKPILISGLGSVSVQVGPFSREAHSENLSLQYRWSPLENENVPPYPEIPTVSYRAWSVLQLSGHSLKSKRPFSVQLGHGKVFF